ncbi:T9SS type A sorting domain-containing protein [Flavobacterium terrisoli]|uniref:T9SS type A sorting domain-containing protein n=1 Tax=Flavobacterium terrisoli TaxID=3242195 RepID=UPI002543E306|nr:T9SS type A sorting domain-containing protein [Flavobacterium buctense]
MKKTLLFIFCLISLGRASAQAPQITGDLMLCPWTNGTATVTNPIYDTYQWYSKYWFSSDPYVAIDGATQSSFTYDWYTYDQSLFKVVATLNGNTYESNVIQIDSYAWVGFTVGTEMNEFVSINPNNGNMMLCPGGSFTASIFMPYDSGIQWYKNGTPIDGANEMNYLITGPGSYHVVAAPSFCPNSTSSNESLPIVVEEDTNCNLGVGNPNPNAAFTIYPNPTAATLYLSLSNDAHFTKYRIIDAAGKVLAENNLISGQNTAAINVNHLSAGFYLIQLQGENQTTVKRFIKN